jgi:drug/metabolite transporter (DMT)-like permease
MAVDELRESAPKWGPIARGTAVAVVAAVLFGATAPLITHFGRGVGPFATAALLYVGAGLAAGPWRRTDHEAPVARRHARRIALVALFGAAIAPACLALGLQHAGALAASLLLNLEAVFTIALAALLYGEPLGHRVVVAGTLMVGGGALLAARTADTGGGDWIGIAAVTAATLGWALDNTLTRPLADFDPRAVVFWKALLGAGLSTLAALVARDRWPHVGSACALLGCGAAGYGWSLRLYLRAQRVLGAARTGSLFALGPFVGALIAYGAGDRGGGALTAAASACFVGAVILHATERHGHRHRHDRLEHEHAHRHDDGHHAHGHDPAVLTVHSHWHVHEATEHDHAHAADVHHRHRHE